MQPVLCTGRKRTMSKSEKLKKIEERVKDGSINRQKIWKYVQEWNSVDDEHLDATAIIDCAREYTYREMFDEWKRYARAFSGLGICSSNGSRAAVCGSICAEPLFAFYALNMTGVTVSMLSYPDFLPSGNWKATLKKEKITDLIISDILVTPQLFRDIEKEKDELGLRNVILLHSRLGGAAVGPAELVYNEFNHHTLKRMSGTVFMDELIESYKDTPVRYSRTKGSDIAVITHTSGTTKGIRKPLPYTDEAVNIKTTRQKDNLSRMVQGGGSDAQIRVPLEFDYSSYLVLCGLANGFLSNGDTIVLTCFGFLHPKFIRAVDYYDCSILNASGFMIDKWIERKDLDDLDLSSVKMILIGGSYMSPEKVTRYEKFFEEHGYKGVVIRGYGMSEAGSAQIMVPPGNKEDILGYPGNKDDFMIQDEDDGKFYTLDEGPRTGVMYVASDSLCCNELDGEVLFDFTVINGKNFLCTNDLIRLNENGSLSYAGRSDKYFANNEGVQFDSGIVDVHMAAHPAINMCAVVPVFEKRIHDTVPVLYVVPGEKGPGAEERIREAFVDVYVKKKKIADSNLPVQFVIVNSIPCNSNGKIDIFRITRDRLKGKAYNIHPVRENGELTDIKIELAEQLSSITGGALPEGMEGNSAFDLMDVFSGSPSGEPAMPAFVSDALRCFGGRLIGDMPQMIRFVPPFMYTGVLGKLMDSYERMSF